MDLRSVSREAAEAQRPKTRPCELLSALKDDKEKQKILRWEDISAMI